GGHLSPVPTRRSSDLEVTTMTDDILIFGGSGSPKLTLKICEYLNVQPGAGEVLRFSEGNLFVRVKENVRGRRVYLVQSTVFPTKDRKSTRLNSSHEWI